MELVGLMFLNSRQVFNWKILNKEKVLNIHFIDLKILYYELLINEWIN